jgi:c-di-GMP-binding flagellar brake protein YcgR
MLLSDNRTESYSTVDISKGGVCFLARRRFWTDEEIKIRIWLLKDKEPLYAKARVAWIKNIGLLAKDNKYKVGLEFIELKNRDKRILFKFMKSISV